MLDDLIAVMVKGGLDDIYNMDQFINAKTKAEERKKRKAILDRLAAEKYFKSDLFLLTGLDFNYLKKAYTSSSFVHEIKGYKKLTMSYEKLKKQLKFIRKEEEGDKVIYTYIFTAEFVYTYKYIYKNDKLDLVIKYVS